MYCVLQSQIWRVMKNVTENATAKQVASVVTTSVLEDASELAKSDAGLATPFHHNNIHNVYM